MNPQSSPLPAPAPRPDGTGAATRPAPARAQPPDEIGSDLPSLTHILAHYRQHGTVAGSLAAWPLTAPAPVATQAHRPSVPPVAAPALADFLEPIEGLHSRELDPALFEQFFGSGARS